MHARVPAGRTESRAFKPILSPATAAPQRRSGQPMMCFPLDQVPDSLTYSERTPTRCTESVRTQRWVTGPGNAELKNGDQMNAKLLTELKTLLEERARYAAGAEPVVVHHSPRM